jgi:hypothetical protein
VFNVWKNRSMMPLWRSDYTVDGVLAVVVHMQISVVGAAVPRTGWLAGARTTEGRPRLVGHGIPRRRDGQAGEAASPC